MPLYKSIQTTNQTKILIWKIEESFDALSKGIELTNRCQIRVDSMKSELHKRGFMSIRHLLAEEGYEDKDLFYDEFGKPHLTDEKFISITHSFNFAAIIVSDNHPVGIDIEKQRDKIVRIAHKFTPFEEYKTLANHDALVRKLTIVWGAKESLYKIYEQKGLSFLQDINIRDFSFNDGRTVASIRFIDDNSTYNISFLEFEGFTCVYAIK